MCVRVSSSARLPGVRYYTAPWNDGARFARLPGPIFGTKLAVLDASFVDTPVTMWPLCAIHSFCTRAFLRASRRWHTSLRSFIQARCGALVVYGGPRRSCPRAYIACFAEKLYLGCSISKSVAPRRYVITCHVHTL